MVCRFASGKPTSRNFCDKSSSQWREDMKTKRFDFPTRAKKPSRPWDGDPNDANPVPIPTLVEDTWPADHLVGGFKPWVSWQLQPASEKQLDVLRKRGWDPPVVPGLFLGTAWATLVTLDESSFLAPTLGHVTFSLPTDNGFKRVLTPPTRRAIMRASSLPVPGTMCSAAAAALRFRLPARLKAVLSDTMGDARSARLMRNPTPRTRERSR
jgi:hypothetical protein